MSDFRTFVEAHGIIAPPVIIPGKWHRCSTVSHPRKRNASIKLAADEQVGWAHDFAVDAEPIMWRDGGAPGKPRPLIDQARLHQLEAERRAALKRATLEARAVYEASKPLRGSHPYLAAKNLTMAGCEGLRVDAKGWLVVPMFYHGRVLSVQRISPDGDKLYHPGATTKLASLVLERRRASVTVLCEGLATGLTLFNAIPDSRVVVCFTAHNLAPIARTLERVGMAVVCADNDHETAARFLERTGVAKNPGLEAAQLAATVLGVGVAYPTCNGSDWNDYAAEQNKFITVQHSFSFAKKMTPLQIQQQVNADIRHHVMRHAKMMTAIAQV